MKRSYSSFGSSEEPSLKRSRDYAPMRATLSPSTEPAKQTTSDHRAHWKTTNVVRDRLFDTTSLGSKEKLPKPINTNTHGAPSIERAQEEGSRAPKWYLRINVLESAAANQRDAWTLRRKDYSVRSVTDYFLHNEEADEICPGEKRWMRFCMLVGSGKGSLKWKLHTFQKEFMKIIKMALAPLIWGIDWEANKARVCESEGWNLSDLNRFCLGSAPRRFGKSVVVAMCMAAFALSMDGSVQCCFSTGRRASEGTLKIVKNTLAESGYAHLFVKANSEALEIRSIEDRNKISTMRFFPANATVSESFFLLFSFFFSMEECRRRRAPSFFACVHPDGLERFRLFFSHIRTDART